MKSDDISSEHTNWWNICMRELVDRSKEAYPFEDTP